MLKLLKAIALIALIFGLLYSGIVLYFVNYKSPQASEAEMSKNEHNPIEQVREQIASTEQLIQDKVRESLSISEEEHLLDSLKAIVGSLRKEERSATNGQAEKNETLTASSLFELANKNEGIVKLLFFALLLVALIVMLLTVPRKKREESKKTVTGRKIEKSLTNELESTLEKFRSKLPVQESVEQKQPPPQKPVLVNSVTIADKSVPENKGNLVELVFELSRKGFSVEEIAEQAHIDQDQVRLILRFKQ